MSKTPDAPHPKPNSGGRYMREADGTLKRVSETDAAAPTDTKKPAKAAAKKES
ncbi:MAG: hypothetical protein AAGM84_05610 [Pseudomonadota bacterium]